MTSLVASVWGRLSEGETGPDGHSAAHVLADVIRCLPNHDSALDAVWTITSNFDKARTPANRLAGKGGFDTTG